MPDVRVVPSRPQGTFVAFQVQLDVCLPTFLGDAFTVDFLDRIEGVEDDLAGALRTRVEEVFDSMRGDGDVWQAHVLESLKAYVVA